MRNPLILFCVGFMVHAGAASAADEWTIFRSERGIVVMDACGSRGNVLIDVNMPAYSIGGEALDAWFAKQIDSRVTGWSGAYQVSGPEIRHGDGDYLVADVTFASGGEFWKGVFFAKSRGGRAQWSVLLGPRLGNALESRFGEMEAGLDEYYRGDELIFPEQLKSDPLGSSAALGDGTPVGFLRSNSAKWLLNGSLVDGNRRYVLMDNGVVHEIVPSSNHRIASGLWGRLSEGFQIAWDDGSVEIVPQACFSPDAEAPSAEQVEAPPAPGESGGECHTEKKLVTVVTTHFSCFPAPCGMKQGPVSQYQYVQVCN